MLLGAYSALSRQVNVGTVKLYTRYEMEDVVIIDGRARGIIAKNLVTGKLERFCRSRCGYRYRRLRQRILPLYQCNGLQLFRCHGLLP